MARKTGSHSEITGPRIAETALKLFAQHGFAAVSMRQIAAEVGVQAGAIYNYVPDKQTLLADMLSRHMEEVLAAWADYPKSNTLGPAAELEDFIRFHIEFHMTRKNQVFIAYMELRNLTTENFRRVERLRRAYESNLAQILARGATAGEFDVPHPKINAYAIIAMLNGVLNWYRADGQLDEKDVQDEYWTMVRQMVGIR